MLDGNSGIGGDVGGLLARLREVVGRRGQVIVEAGAHVPGTHEVLTARFAGGGPAFRWAVASRDMLVREGIDAGLVVQEQWTCAGRDFVSFSRAA